MNYLNLMAQAETSVAFWTNLSTILSALGTLSAVIVAWIVYIGQSRLNQRIHDEQQKLAIDLNQKEASLIKAQNLSMIFHRIFGSSEVNSKSVVWPDVTYNSNLLQEVATYISQGVIEFKAAQESFGDHYIRLFEQIDGISKKRFTKYEKGLDSKKWWCDFPGVRELYNRFKEEK